MDCVYHAYADYLEWLDIKATPLDYTYYKILKWWMQGSKPQYTFGGVAPWIIDKLAMRHGLAIGTQHRIYTNAHYLAYAKEYYPAHYKRMRPAIEYGYGDGWDTKEELTLQPAIYLLLGSSHAIFAVRVPRFNMPVVAIHLNKGVIR